MEEDITPEQMKEAIRRQTIACKFVPVKLEERPFGQLTYTRIHQGTRKRGGSIYNIDDGNDGNLNLAMSSMFVPEPVMSLAVKPKVQNKQNAFGKVNYT